MLLFFLFFLGLLFFLSLARTPTHIALCLLFSFFSVGLSGYPREETSPGAKTNHATTDGKGIVKSVVLLPPSLGMQSEEDNLGRGGLSALVEEGDGWWCSQHESRSSSVSTQKAIVELHPWPDWPRNCCPIRQLYPF